MAKEGTKGQGWHGASEAHGEVGAKGGKKTAERHGPEFYSEIGHKGGKKSSGKFQKGSERARQAGREGGSK